MIQFGDKVLTLAETALAWPEVIGDVSKLKRWIFTGVLDADGERVTLPAAKIGGRWFVRPSDVTAFVAEINRPGPRPAGLSHRRRGNRAGQGRRPRQVDAHARAMAELREAGWAD